VLREVAGKITRRGMIIVMSDLFDTPDLVMRALQYFRHRRNEVMVFHLLDNNELEFPFERLTVFEDIEAVQHRVLAEHFLEEYRQACRRERIDYNLFPTTTPLDIALTRYLARRQ
jgi:hypothetical protein